MPQEYEKPYEAPEHVYNPQASAYSTEPPPPSMKPVYAPMAERIAQNFKAEYGGLDEIPVRYCQIEDLDESLASLAAVAVDLVALRTKHRFCRQLVVQYGVVGEGLWAGVTITRSSLPTLDLDALQFTAICRMSGGESLYNWSSGIGDIMRYATLGVGSEFYGLVADREEIDAKLAAIGAGTWDGDPDTWDYETLTPIPPPEPPKPTRKRRSKKDAGGEE